MGDRPPRPARARQGARRPRRAAARPRPRDPHLLRRRLRPRRRRGASGSACGCPRSRPATAAALRERLPAAATIANPLDYTAMIWGDREWQRDLVALVGDDPGIDQVLVFYDHPPGLDGASARELAGGRGRHPRRRRREPRARCSSPRPCPSCSTTPPPGASPRPASPPSPGSAPASPAPPPCRRRRPMRSGCARWPPRAAGRTGAGPSRPGRAAWRGRPGLRRSLRAGRWLAEHETKALLRAAGIPVVDGRIVAGEDDAVAALAELGGPVAVKLSSPELRHKTAAGALALDVAAEPAPARRPPRARRPQRRAARCSWSGWRRPAPS